VVGGRSPHFVEMGVQAGQIVERLLDGASPASLQLASVMPNRLRVDVRQARRWAIADRDIPDDAVLQFKEPTFWEAYRRIALSVACVFLLQAALIGALLLERRRRRKAELAVQLQRSQVAHASRLAIAGELTASIAHEINQPLGAILASADAAEMILKAGGDRREDLTRIISRIRRDDLRASDVIRKLRALLAKHEPERERFDLGLMINDVAKLLEAEGHRREVALEVRPMQTDAMVVGDPVQLQQVLINLILNAMEAVAEMPPDRRSVVVDAALDGDSVSVSVRDRGQGITADNLPKIFESFFSTKQKGMGLGLSIARTIVEAHGGRIQAENGLVHGAVFRIELPAATTRSSSMVAA
jgi:C4-dicarboxylate-specific signal transduction histidine kinase